MPHLPLYKEIEKGKGIELGVFLSKKKMEVSAKILDQYSWMIELLGNDVGVFLSELDHYELNKSVEFAAYCRSTLKRKWFESESRFIKRKKETYKEALLYKFNSFLNEKRIKKA